MARKHVQPIRSRPALLAWLCGCVLFVLASLTFASVAGAQQAPTRPVLLEWDADERLLYMSVGFRDVIDDKIQEKLSRGLPTTIVLTAALYRGTQPEAVSTTAQTCKVTWHVWEEAYRVEITRPGGTQVRWTTTIEGVLRRCAEAHRLLAGDRSQILEGTPIRVVGKIQVNPISPEVLTKIQRWVTRPASTGTAAPGDALFSTFTGLFLQRVGDAERDVKFATRPTLPTTFHSRK
ncbi:MAG: hypothetical protein QM773_10475 [Hyphomonadaceae bacterium]